MKYLMKSLAPVGLAILAIVLFQSMRETNTALAFVVGIIIMSVAIVLVARNELKKR